MRKQIVPKLVMRKIKLDWWKMKENVPLEDYIPNRAAAWALEQAATALELEYVDSDATGQHDDIVYNAAVEHCILSVRAMIGEGGKDGQG